VIALALMGVLAAAAAGPAASPPKNAPANDARAKAQQLADLPAKLVGSTSGATHEATDPRCGAPMVGTVWYGFSRSRPGTVQVSFQSASQLDAVVGVYQVVSDQLKLLRCEVTDAKGHARFVFETHPRPKHPINFLLLVGQRVNSDPGKFTLAVAAPETPSNDELAGALTVAKLPATIRGSTIGATHDIGDPGCASDGSTVWYRLQPGPRGRMVVGLKAGADLEANLCVIEKVRSQLRPVADQATDDHGRAQLQFERQAGSRYYILVGQSLASEPGPYTLAVAGLTRPVNDVLAAATTLGTLPATVDGTTVGALRDASDPDCAAGQNTVWYRFDRHAAGSLVLYLKAVPRAKASVCVLQKQASKLVYVTDEVQAQQKGVASYAFDAAANSSYAIVVSEAGGAKPGPFTLTLFAPEKPPVPPGVALRADGARGRLDPLQNPADAWATPMTRGLTYRFGVFTTNGACVKASVFTPQTKSFDDAVPVAESPCGRMVSFTPGPDGGGTYSILVEVRGKPTSYRAVVRRAQPDDIGPGVAIGNGTRRTDTVSTADPLDLYRLDIVRQSDLRVTVDANKDLDVRLLDASGNPIRSVERGVELVRVLSPRTYFIAVKVRGEAARYQLHALVRDVTTTSLTVDGGTSTRVKPGQTVTLRTTTTPVPKGGTTRLQADFYDIVTRAWVFRQTWAVAPGASVAFTPNAVGQWRVRATFSGSHESSPSRTEYRPIWVAPLTAQDL
jgi:hypothetical protein